MQTQRQGKDRTMTSSHAGTWKGRERQVTEKHWKDRAMTSSQAITDAWDVTKAYLARLAEWVLFACMIMNIIEILPGVVLPGLVSNLVLCVQAVTLDVAGFGLASMADHARDTGDERAARTGKRTGWFLIGLMIVTLVLVSIGLLWPATQQFTAPAEKVLILARVIMTVVYSHVVHSLRRSTHAPQAVPAVPTLDYAEIARNLYAQFSPPAPQIDHQALAQQIMPLIPPPQVDYQTIKEQLEATCKEIIGREVTAMRSLLASAEGGSGASLRPRSQSQPVALEPPIRATRQSQPVAPEPPIRATSWNHPLASEPSIRATRQSHLAEPEPLAGATGQSQSHRSEPPVRAIGQSHRSEPASGSRATVESQSEPPAGDTLERLEAAYQELAAEGGRVSGRALAARARCNRTTATEWLQRQYRGAEVESEPQEEATPESQPEPVEVSA